jgi:hypothetical protein
MTRRTARYVRARWWQCQGRLERLSDGIPNDLPARVLSGALWLGLLYLCFAAWSMRGL